MTFWLLIIFWGCAALVAYTYVVYPLLLACAVKLRGRSVRRAPFTGSVSFVLAAQNETARVAGRRDELSSYLRGAGVSGEVIIVSDGSTDGTADAARAGAGDGIRVIELMENVGKAAAISQAVASAAGDVRGERAERLARIEAILKEPAPASRPEAAA